MNGRVAIPAPERIKQPFSAARCTRSSKADTVSSAKEGILARRRIAISLSPLRLCTLWHVPDPSGARYNLSMDTTAPTHCDSTKSSCSWPASLSACARARVLAKLLATTLFPHGRCGPLQAQRSATRCAPGATRMDSESIGLSNTNLLFFSSTLDPHSPPAAAPPSPFP